MLKRDGPGVYGDSRPEGMVGCVVGTVPVPRRGGLAARCAAWAFSGESRSGSRPARSVSGSYDRVGEARRLSIVPCCGLTPS